MKFLRITGLSSYLALIAFTAISIGCFTDKVKPNTKGRQKYTVENWLKSEKYKKYVLANKKEKTKTVESQMDQHDREYLEDNCTDCHDLKRVFLRRGSKSSWEALLNKEQHEEIGLDSEEKSQLLKIFQTYLGEDKSQAIQIIGIPDTPH
jgi:hypothetical protein